MARDNAALLEQLTTMRYGFGDVAGSPCLVAARSRRCSAARLDRSVPTVLGLSDPLGPGTGADLKIGRAHV